MRSKSLLQEQAYNAITHMIHSGEMQPGILYSETKLARDLGFSRTPMREALQCLAQDGYINIIPSKGFTLRQLNREDMLETIQIRCALEGFCVQYISSESGTKKYNSLINKLTAALTKMEQSIDAADFPKSFIKYDHEFHLLLIRYVNNQEINQLFRKSMYLIELTSAASLSVPGRAETTLQEHQEILACLLRGDGDAAYRFMIAHLMLPLNMKMF